MKTKKYGSDELDIQVKDTRMSEAELSLFIIEAIDESDEDVEQQFLKETEDLEEADLSKVEFIKPFSKMANNETMTQEDFIIQSNNMRVYRKLLRENRRKQVLAIKRRHVNEKRMTDLYLPLVPEVLKMVITDLTEDSRNKKIMYKQRLTDALERGLKAQMPPIIKTCYKRYPTCFNICPGFEYKMSPHYGNLKLFIQPQIPDYFNDYMQVIEECLNHFRYTYDRYTEKYYEYNKQLLKEETRLAYKLTKFKNRLQLLENDVDIYLKYIDRYNEYKQNNLNDDNS